MRPWGVTITDVRLHGARIAAGMTLKQVAAIIGYSWIAVERWEKNTCPPKPGVLWHLRHIYGAGEDWFPAVLPSPGQTWSHTWQAVTTTPSHIPLR
jgi:transcriptional regulator with XRE-family HTH domain